MVTATLLSLSMRTVCAVALGLGSQPGDQGVWSSLPADRLIQEAADGKKLVLLYAYMPGSDHCDKMLGNMTSSDRGKSELEGLLCAKVDLTSPVGAQILERYPVAMVPTSLILTPSGALEDAIVGVVSPSEFVQQIRRIKKGTKTLGALQAAIDRSPKDLDSRLALANKLQFLGDAKRHAEVIASIRNIDPTGKTVVGAQLILSELQNAAVAKASEGSTPSPIDLGPVYAYVRKTRHAPVAFSGWRWLASQERMQGRNQAGRQAMAKAWKEVGDNQRIQFGTDLVNTYFEEREQLSRSERKLVDDVSKQCQRIAEDAWDRAGGASPPAPVATQTTLIEAYTARALALALQKRKAQALKLLDKALQIAPQNILLEETRETIMGVDG